MACMTDKASEFHGYVVKVSVPYVGGGTETTIFYARIADPGKARAAARAVAGVGADAEAIIVAPLTASPIKELEEKFGLANRAVMHWMRI